MILITLPGQPLGKGRPRFSPRAIYTPKRTRAFENALGYAARAVMRGKKPLSGVLAVRVIARFAIPKGWTKAQKTEALTSTVWHGKRPDADNVLKMLDALNGIVFDDDCQIASVTVDKIYSADPALLIAVEEINGPNPFGASQSLWRV